MLSNKKYFDDNFLTNIDTTIVKNNKIMILMIMKLLM